MCRTKRNLRYTVELRLVAGADLLNVGRFLVRQCLLPHVPNNLADLLHHASCSAVSMGCQEHCLCLLCACARLQRYHSRSASSLS